MKLLSQFSIEELIHTDIEQLKLFMGLTDEEQAMEIRRMEWAKEADEGWKCESLATILKGGPLPSCCENPLFSVRNESNLVVCFNRYGEIVSDVFHAVSMDDVYCLNCNKKPQTPREYIEEMGDYEEKEYHDMTYINGVLGKKTKKVRG